MKKTISLLLALVMILSFGACGKGEPAAQEQPPAADGELHGEITIWSWDLALAYLSDVGKKFVEQNPGVVIHYEEMSTEQVYDKLTTCLASGVGLPDLVTIEGEQMSKFGGKFPDKFLDLSADINTDDFLPVKVGEAMVDGKMLAYPWDAAPCLMFYRKDMYDKAGVNADDIVTWDDFIEAGKKVQEANPGVFMMPMATSRRDHIFRIMLLQQNTYYFDAEGNSCMNSPEAIKAMTLVKKMYDSGITMNETSWDNYLALIKDGKVASVPDGIWMAGTIKDLSPDESGKWGVMPVPQADVNSKGAASSGGSILAIPSTTENAEVAKAFAKFAMTDLDNLIYGLETYQLYPPYLPAFEADIFHQEDAYFSSAKLNELFTIVGEQVPAINYTENFAEASETSKNAVAKVILKDENIEDTMNNLQEEFVVKFGK